MGILRRESDASKKYMSTPGTQAREPIRTFPQSQALLEFRGKVKKVFPHKVMDSCSFYIAAEQNTLRDVSLALKNLSLGSVIPTYSSKF